MTGPVVLVAGSLHHDLMIAADRLPGRDETAVGHRWWPKFGGKGGNQAAAAARAGVRARMLSAVGQDGFGAFLLQGLADAGVDAAFVARLPDVGSGMSVAVQDAAGDYAATIVSGANLMIDAGALSDPALWDGVAALVLQNEVTADLNLAAARAAHARGLPVILNAAPARDIDPALRALTALLVVNAVEAAMMGAGTVSDLPSAARAAAALRGQGWRAVIVTAGAAGLAASAQDTEFSLPAERVTVISSHGAGDAFVGTLAAAIATGAGLQDACRRASLAAARHVSGG